MLSRKIHSTALRLLRVAAPSLKAPAMSALGGVLAPACAARCRTRAVRRPLRVAAVRVEKDEEEQEVTYGNGWYDATRNAAKRDRVTSTRTKLAEYRSANDRANNGKERKDLYSDNWDGDEYKGTRGCRAEGEITRPRDRASASLRGLVFSRLIRSTQAPRSTSRRWWYSSSSRCLLLGSLSPTGATASCGAELELSLDSHKSSSPLKPALACSLYARSSRPMFGCGAATLSSAAYPPATSGDAPACSSARAQLV